VLFAITVHEAAHGYAARHFGDNTAYMMGRITLNPHQAHRPGGHHPDAAAAVLRHLGRLPVRLCQAGAGQLWQPAQTQAHMVWVALAGPASNFVQAVLWAWCWWLLVGLGVDERFFIEMARAGVLVNLVMWAFNLFPLPPLDGGRILVGLLPWKQAHMVSRIEPWGFFIVMGLVIAGVVGSCGCAR
jgi:Zn-dependent protease